LLGDVSRALQQVAQAILEPAGLGLRGDDLAAEEGDGDRVVLALDRQHAGLPLKAEHLEDVGQREDAERSLKTHWGPSSRATARAPRRRRRSPARGRQSRGSAPRAAERADRRSGCRRARRRPRRRTRAWWRRPSPDGRSRTLARPARRATRAGWRG